MIGGTARLACGVGVALTALAVSGLSNTFDFSTIGGGENVGNGGLITVTGGYLTGLVNLPMSNFSVLSWDGDTLNEWDASGSDILTMNLVGNQLQVSGGIASLQISPGTLLWTIDPTSLQMASGREFGLGLGDAAVVMNAPQLLTNLGIVGPVGITLNSLGLILDPAGAGYSSNQFFVESDLLDFSVTQLPEPATLLPFALGLTGLALWRARRKAAANPALLQAPLPSIRPALPRPTH